MKFCFLILFINFFLPSYSQVNGRISEMEKKYFKVEPIKELTAKDIEKQMVKVSASLYACRYETSNEEYNRFLDVLAEKDSALYRKHQVDSLRWLESTGNPPLAEYYHKHAGFKEYPVLTLSYESAVAYGSWLTDHYHSDPERKFKKVVFTLPTEQEWELAAMGTKTNIVFPWGTNSVRDARKGSWQGTFLANFKRGGHGSIETGSAGEPVFREQPDWEREAMAGGLNDRAFYTAPVNSFFPNSLGIYNQSGNAAEMTIQKGLTKGGSWNSYGGEITISYKMIFNEPSVEVGFRVFMKIIEE